MEVKDKNSEEINRRVRDRGMRGEKAGNWVIGLMGGKRPVQNRERERRKEERFYIKKAGSETEKS